MDKALSEENLSVLQYGKPTNVYSAHNPYPLKITAMASPTSVNDQITDAVTQTNVKVLGESPAIAISNLYQATAQALSLAAQHATTAQQQANFISQANATMGVTTLYAIYTASTGIDTSKIFQ